MNEKLEGFVTVVSGLLPDEVYRWEKSMPLLLKRVEGVLADIDGNPDMEVLDAVGRVRASFGRVSDYGLRGNKIRKEILRLASRLERRSMER
ncbi:MAG: hypothetical protein ABII07_02110 [Patescibacteria group bacterium]|nr:hypothetical protein [Patescibacteria group bacterium]